MKVNDLLKIDTKSGFALFVENRITDDTVEVSLRTESLCKCLLHWGLRNRNRSTWQAPAELFWPEGSRAYDQTAIQSPFISDNSTGKVIIRLDKTVAFSLIEFDLFFPEEGRWDNNNGRNYKVEIPRSETPDHPSSQPGRPPAEQEASGPGPELAGLADEIIEKEMSPNSWTLMHRFNLCYDLLDRAGHDADALALIFVWLRFSALRQLDWQRNYNTQPRELGHAQDRLTIRLAGLWIAAAGEKGFIRMALTCLGRGSNGQRVRDEVLNIMHRHHIKEVSGHFMEEWHQKLHNNTTPDDVVICEAYLEFLRSSGDLGLFYKRLEVEGVTRERLESYERPIRSQPDFIPHLKEALIHDFERFLGILKAVHTGTDLGTAIYAARHLLDQEMHALMDFIWHHQGDCKMPVYELAEKTVEARRMLNRQLNELQGDSDLRDRLFLDLALEDFLRIAVERNLHLDLSGDQLVELIALVMESLSFSNHDEELGLCLNHWQRLRQMPRFSKKWSLHAHAVLDRLGRVISAFIDRYYQTLQPKAEFLGRAFKAEAWTVASFSEEVVRGQPVFLLSMLLHHLMPVLRKKADLGIWQVISRGYGMGEVQAVPDLKTVQGRKYERPTIIVADRVSGEEEIPPGVTAVITPDMTDIVSHVAIRARNAGLLFATCYDPGTIKELKSFKGPLINVSVNPAGDVIFKEGPGEMAVLPSSARKAPASISRPSFSAYTLSAGDFNEKSLGGKSCNLVRLKPGLPKWVATPTSVALPFGVFEKVLGEGKNRPLEKHYKALLGKVEQAPEKAPDELLSQLRRSVLDLDAPGELVDRLPAEMDQAGLCRPVKWDEAWMCIKRVWASKWNERAYLSRRAQGISHDDLFMAVLIQEVVEAEYSFVIHTNNPITGNRDEIYAEVVPGLGETLVGNYPGRALGFTCSKAELKPQLLAFPGKSIGLFGSGLIFRSDSNGEDLPEYAGAGLYDSVILPAPQKVLLDYALQPLVWDEQLQTDLLRSIADIGRLVEKTLGSAQDIEGAYCQGRYFVVQTRPQVGLV